MPLLKSWFVAWSTTLQQMWHAIVRIDRSQLTIATAIRSTIGFVLPLILGLATGHLLEGVAMAGGAAGLGAVGLTYTYHVRIRTMLLASLGVAVSAYVGGVTGHIDWLAILVVGVWGVGAGFLVAISQRAMIIGLQSTVALIILAHFSVNPLQALGQAGLMFAGALLQTLLALIPFPWHRFGAERAALSTVYQVLADTVEYPTDNEVGQQVREVFVKAGDVLTDSHPRSQKGSIFYGLLEEADHIHLTLIVLTSIRQHLLADEQQQKESIQQLERVMKASVTVLRGIAILLHPARPLVNLTASYQIIEEAMTALQQNDMRDYAGNNVSQTLLYCEALCHQLHTAEAIAQSWRDTKNISFPVSIPEQPDLRLRNPLSILRANLTLRSTACRHAIRLGVILAIATALYRVFPLQRGYWIPLTALIVLKPDFTTTFTRGAARSVGTILGALLTTLLVSLLLPTDRVLILLDALAAFIAFTFLNVNYAIFSSFLTVEVVILLTFVDPRPLVNTFDRALDTVIGGALALLAYVLWPTWERTRVPEKLAARLEALRRYFDAVMAAYAHPTEYDAPSMQHLRQEARLARTNAAASVERSLSEPVHYHTDPDTARGLLAATDLLAKSVLALDAYLLNTPTQQPFPAITPFAREVDETMTSLLTSVYCGEKLAEPTKLEQELHTLEKVKHAITSETNKIDWESDNEADTERKFVSAEAKHIVHSLNAIRQLLSRKPTNAL